MLPPKQRDRFLAERRAELNAARPSQEIRAERDLQARFKQDVRTVGIHRAVDRMEAANDAKRLGEKHTALGNREAQIKDLFPPTIGVRSCGRYTRSSDTRIEGVGGILTQHYYDGAIVIEEFKPTEGENHGQATAFRNVYQPEHEHRF